jgi:hypothetical protein
MPLSFFNDSPDLVGDAKAQHNLGLMYAERRGVGYA